MPVKLNEAPFPWPSPHGEGERKRHRGGGVLVFFGVPTGIRTPVIAVKGRCPRPLDDGDYEQTPARFAGAGVILVGGGKRDRTADLLHAMQALSQLSYTPVASKNLASPRGFEPLYSP